MWYALSDQPLTAPIIVGMALAWAGLNLIQTTVIRRRKRTR